MSVNCDTDHMVMQTTRCCFFQFQSILPNVRIVCIVIMHGTRMELPHDAPEAYASAAA